MVRYVVEFKYFIGTHAYYDVIDLETDEVILKSASKNHATAKAQYMNGRNNG